MGGKSRDEHRKTTSATRRGMRQVVNSTDLFGGSSFRVAVAKGTAATDSSDSDSLGRVAGDTRGEKGTA